MLDFVVFCVTVLQSCIVRIVLEPIRSIIIESWSGLTDSFRKNRFKRTIRSRFGRHFAVNSHVWWCNCISLKQMWNVERKKKNIILIERLDGQIIKTNHFAAPDALTPFDSDSSGL